MPFPYRRSAFHRLPPGPLPTLIMLKDDRVMEHTLQSIREHGGSCSDIPGKICGYDVVYVYVCHQWVVVTFVWLIY